MRAANIVCTRPLQQRQGRDGEKLRVFKQFAWFEAAPGKVALYRPAHERVTRAVGGAM